MVSTAWYTGTSHMYFSIPTLLICGVLEMLLVSGVVFGWSALTLMLRREGVYAHLCTEEERENNSHHNGETSVCSAQELRLNLAFVIASTVMTGLSIVWGTINDRYGPRLAHIGACCMLVSGSILFALADPVTLDVFIPGLTLMAAAGPGVLLSHFHLANLRPQYQGMIIGAISGAFDSSTLVFYLFDLINEKHPDITRVQLFVGYTVLCSILLINCFFMWPRQPFAVGIPYAEAYSHYPAPKRIPIHEPTTIAVASVHDAIGVEMTSRHTRTQTEDNNSNNNNNNNHNNSNNAHIPIMYRPFKEQIRTKEYALIQFITVVAILRFNFYFGTVTQQLTLIDQQKSPEYTRVFNIVVLCSIVTMPLIGYLLDKKGVGISFAITHLFGLIFAITVLFPNLPLQNVSFICFSLWRAWHFAASAAYQVKIFGFLNLGKLAGLLAVIAGIFSFLQYPLLSLSLNTFNNNFFPANCMFAGFAVILMYNAWQIYGIEKSMSHAHQDTESAPDATTPSARPSLTFDYHHSSHRRGGSYEMSDDSSVEESHTRRTSVMKNAGVMDILHINEESDGGI